MPIVCLATRYIIRTVIKYTIIKIIEVDHDANWPPVRSVLFVALTRL
jgi:hypothetical protein